MRKFLALLALAAALPGQEEAPPETRLDDANRKAVERVYRTVAREGDHLLNRLRGLKKEDVIVVGGLFDFMQEMLVAFRCPHTVIRPSELEHHDLEPAGRKIVLLNCHLLDRSFPVSTPPGDPPGEKEAKENLERVLKEAGLDGDEAPGKAIRKRFAEIMIFAGSDYSEAGLARLGQAVRGGAWLVSTDWALLAVERALPGTVRWTGRTTFEETIEVRPSLTGKRHSLLKGAFPDSGKARWWLESESYLFSVKGKHRMLVESRSLGARYGGNRNVVVLLEPGKGRVLHALSHGYLQKGGVEDVSVMQRLLLNFLIEKSVANHKRTWDDRKKEEGKK